MSCTAGEGAKGANGKSSQGIRDLRQASMLPDLRVSKFQIRFRFEVDLLVLLTFFHHGNNSCEQSRLQEDLQHFPGRKRIIKSANRICDLANLAFQKIAQSIDP